MEEPHLTEEKMELPPHELGKRTVRSIGALFFFRFFLKLITRIRTFLVIPFLVASDFGLTSLSLSIFAFAGMPMLGFGKSIIPEKKEIDQMYSVHTVFTFGFTTTIGFVIILFRNSLANLFDAPLLGKILLVTTCANIFFALGSGAQLKLRREIRQSIVAIVEALANGLDLFVTVFLAFSGYGVWSLVYGSITGQTVATISFLSITKAPSKWFSRTHVLRYFRGGINYNLFEVLVVTLSSVADLLVGFFSGVYILGYYSIALGIAMLLTGILVYPITYVAFPAYARMDSKTLGIGLKRTLEFSSISLFGSSLIGIFMIKYLIIFFFGEEWLPAATLAQISLVLAVVSGLLGILGSYLLAQRETKILIRVNLYRLGILLVIGIPLIYYFGVIGMIVTQILHTSVALFVTGKFVSKQMGVKLFKESLYPASTAGLLTVGIVSISFSLFDINALEIVILIILSYGIGIAFTGRNTVIALSRLIKHAIFSSGE